MQIHIARDGKIIGQYSREELQAKIVSGEISQEDFAWYDGLPEWVPLSTLLANLNEPNTLALGNTGSFVDEEAADEPKQSKKVLGHDWRLDPATDKQKSYIASFGIDVPEGITKGQAGDLIGRARNDPATVERQQQIREAQYEEQRRIQEEQRSIQEEQRKFEAEHPSYYLKQMISSGVKGVEEAKKEKREAKALLDKKNKKLAAVKEKRAISTDEFEQMSLDNEIKDLEDEASEAEVGFDRVNIEEPKDELKYESGLRIKFWKATFPSGGRSLEVEDWEGLADYTETITCYSDLGGRFKVPTNEQILAVLNSLDQQSPDWDKTQPEQFYSALAASFPDLIRSERIHQRTSRTGFGCLLLTAAPILYYLLIHLR